MNKEDEMKFTADDMILFMTWVRENDTMENAERWFGYTNMDMLKEWMSISKVKKRLSRPISYIYNFK